MKSEDIASQIDKLRTEYGSDLAILAHHYQNDQVVAHADLCGDSLELARKIPSLRAKRIVMCGVYFMAESASILAQPEQEVYIPAPEAGCMLSNTAPPDVVEAKLRELNSKDRTIIPLAYVNTSAAVKAVCARFGGSVCTSANAATMLKWALGQGDGVLFLPDRNLAQNTAKSLGLSEREWTMLSLRAQAEPGQARLFIWPGVCAVHHLIKVKHIDHIRQTQPQAKIIVHPECPPEVVDAADANGSTSTIIRYVQEAGPGATIYVGTEINLVQRLAREHAPGKTVRPLLHTACSKMAEVDLENLYQTLLSFPEHTRVQVPGAVQQEAVLALERMLQACT